MSQLPDTEEAAMARKTTRTPAKGRRRFLNNPPTDEVPVSTDELKREFARRLQHHMVNKGWNQSDLARAAAKFTPDKTFNRDNISLYVRARQLPGPIFTNALCKALGLERADLLPDGVVATVDDKFPTFALRPLGNGNDWVQVNMGMPHDIAMQIAALVGQANLKK